jgi:hypothetical protein
MAKPKKPSLGKIIKMLSYGCGPSWQIWVKAAEPAALRLFWSLLPTDWKSEVKLATGKSWLKHVKGVMREGEEVLPDVLTAAGEAVFTIAEVVDQLAWWVYIASVIGDFLIEWSTLAFQMAPGDPGSCAFVLKGDNAFGGTSFGAPWLPGASFHETWPDPTQLIGSLHSCGPGQTLWMNVYYEGWNDDVRVAIDIQIVDLDTGEVLALAESSQQEMNNGYGTLLSAQINGGTTGRSLQHQVRPSAGNTATLTTFKNGSIIVAQSGYSPVM